MNFFITSPHSGEDVPTEASWLKDLPETLLMADVDRYVDQLYEGVTNDLAVEFIKTPWHRYAADLNRTPFDIDCDSVIGNLNKSGSHTDGLHWTKTKQGEVLMAEPMSEANHKVLLQKCYFPFHEKLKETYLRLRKSHSNVYQLDAHSMPSMGTKFHRDPGEKRASVVISDQDGKSCSSSYFELVCESYKKSGFDVKTNWPYKGGGITQTYGEPDIGHHCVQVELNRSLYMSEISKKKNMSDFEEVKLKIHKAVLSVYEGVRSI